MTHRTHSSLALSALFVAGVLSCGTARAQSAVPNLIGTWGGSGRITYTDGSSEAIRCTAYNTGGGANLKMNIQCKSDRNPVNIRSDLTIESGRVSGQWEERTFNASGSASGKASGSNLSLSVSGGGFNGTMSVSVASSSLNISLTTQGIAMSRASMNLNKQ